MYKHTQIGWVTLVSLVTGILVVGSSMALYSDLMGGERLILWLNAAVLIVLAVCMILFASLTVVVDSESVKIAFGPGLISRSVRLDAIESCRTVRNRWWYGWGIRWIPGGLLYNVSGLDAVELRLVNGKKRRIGTDQPQDLEKSINEKLDQAQSDRKV
jgi:hypothetical protein